MFHYCAHCDYKSHHKWVLRRHINSKHKNHSEMTQAQNQYHSPYSRAPTTISVGQDGGRAPTTYYAPGPEVGRAPSTVSVPPQRMGVQDGSGVQPATAYNPHPYVHPYLNNNNQQAYTYPQRTPANSSAPTVMSVGPDGPRAPTTVSVPPFRSQQGAGIDVYDEDMDTDEESDSSGEDEEDKDPDVNDILVDISTTFSYLQHLRKQYRDLLPQLKEFKEEEMEGFLEFYSLVKTDIIDEQDGLEGTVFKKQYGKGVNDDESEGETDEETVDEDEDDDADTENVDTEDGDDTEEETVDSEEGETEESDDEQAEDMDVIFDKIEEDEPTKEPFFNFVFEAENFLDAKSKEKLEKYLTHDKKNLKLVDGCDQDETDIPKNVREVIEDIEDVCSMWNKKEEECFKRCSKRKIQSVCNMANNWMDATSLHKMKKINPSKYRFLKNMLKPHKNSLDKLVNPKVSIHEKRKTLQKPQVGEGILHTAANLMLPLLNQILKR
jgi:hypothetical protein